jgi:CHAD domain-containing protein
MGRVYYSSSAQEFFITGERRYPAPVIAVSNRTQASQPPLEIAPAQEPARPKRRTTLPNDLLDRTDEEAARRLALKAVAAARAAERRLDDRADPEALHDFRVAVRRLRSLLRAYKPQLETAVRKKDRQTLRDIQRATGGGREAEVALEWLTKQRDLSSEHLAGLNWLSATLMARKRECEHALDGEVRAEFRRTADRLEEKLAIMKSETNLLADGFETSFGRTLANLTEAHATDLLVQLSQIVRMDDVERLHEARILGKRLRYLLEPVRAYVDEAQPVVKRAKRLQDVLGDLNDVHVLMNEIDHAFDDSLKEKASRIKASLARGDIDRARRDATMLEWAGLVELYSRLENERRTLIAKLRDKWLERDLDALVGQARDLAHDLRARDPQ